jgi:hypothetical protein
MVGAVVSTTVTSNEPMSLLPLSSVALQLTVFRPSGNSEPDAGIHSMAGSGSVSSVAVTA